MQSLAYKTYGQVQQRTTADGDIEYALFKQITEALRSVEENSDVVPAVRADAISRNLQMWTILAADLMGEGNVLPQDTRNGLLYLAEFVRRTSMPLLLSGSGGVSDLIEINETIMEGLRGTRAEDTIGEES